MPFRVSHPWSPSGFSSCVNAHTTGVRGRDEDDDLEGDDVPIGGGDGDGGDDEDEDEDDERAGSKGGKASAPRR